VISGYGWVGLKYNRYQHGCMHKGMRDSNWQQTLEHFSLYHSWMNDCSHVTTVYYFTLNTEPPLKTTHSFMGKSFHHCILASYGRRTDIHIVMQWWLVHLQEDFSDASTVLTSFLFCHSNLSLTLACDQKWGFWLAGTDDSLLTVWGPPNSHTFVLWFQWTLIKTQKIYTKE